MENLEGLLSAHPFFHELPPRYLALVVGCASNVRFEAGEFLFRTATEANHFFLIRHGRAALEIAAPGRPPLILETLGEGEVIGWSWLIAPYRWMFDARALEQTRAVAIDGKCLRGKCEADHDLGYELFKRIAYVMERRLTAARLQLLDVYGTRS